MAAARGLDLVLGAVATGTSPRRGNLGRGPLREPTRGAGQRGAALVALPSAAVLAAHTYAVTTVSRREAQGGSTIAPLAALAATLGLGALAARERQGPGGLPPTQRRRVSIQPGKGASSPRARQGVGGGAGESTQRPPETPAPTLALTPARLLAATYIRTAATPLLHAALNPSPPLTQRAVGGGIRAMIPLQAALAARAGAGATALAVMGLVPLARKLARKVSPT